MAAQNIELNIAEGEVINLSEVQPGGFKYTGNMIDFNELVRLSDEMDSDLLTYASGGLDNSALVDGLIRCAPPGNCLGFKALVTVVAGYSVFNESYGPEVIQGISDLYHSFVE